MIDTVAVPVLRMSEGFCPRADHGAMTPVGFPYMTYLSDGAGICPQCDAWWFVDNADEMLYCRIVVLVGGNPTHMAQQCMPLILLNLANPEAAEFMVRDLLRVARLHADNLWPGLRTPTPEET